MILETRKQDMIKTWYALSTVSLQIFTCPITFLSWRYSLLLLFHAFRDNHRGEVFCKSWEENDKYLRKSRCFYKSTTILKMNSLIVTFINFYHRYGTILWKEEFYKKSYFCRTTRSGCFQTLTQKTVKNLR